MIKTFIQIVFLLILSGCTPSYTWVNDGYPVSQMKDQFAVDQGSCRSEANDSYPDPYPVDDPDDVYYQCMLNNRTEGTPTDMSDDEITVSRPVRQNPYVCTPTHQARQEYRAYETELRRQRHNRTNFIDGCLSLKGWKKTPTE